MAFLTEAAGLQIHVFFPDNAVLWCSAAEEFTLIEAKVEDVDALFPLCHS